MVSSISGSVNIYSNVLYIIKQPLAEKVWDIWPLHAVGQILDLQIIVGRHLE